MSVIFQTYRNKNSSFLVFPEFMFTTNQLSHLFHSHSEYEHRIIHIGVCDGCNGEVGYKNEFTHLAPKTKYLKVGRKKVCTY